MAAGLPSEEQRAALIQMAETWERLAVDRGSPGAAAVNAQPNSQEAEDDAA
jgi:hypothetical protein